MIKYAKVINAQKQCEVGLGTNTAFYQSIGMTEMEVEQAYDGQWYVAGYAPEKNIAIRQSEVRSVRNQYLAETDKYIIADYPITDEERGVYKAYRVYLRDYTKIENWFEKQPKNFDEWRRNLINV